MEQIREIKWEVKRSGQVRSHADSIYEYEVETALPEYEVKRFCTSFLKPSKHEGGGSFSGACSFPHGMDSFYKFEKLEDNKYRYTVCSPYTG